MPLLPLADSDVPLAQALSVIGADQHLSLFMERERSLFDPFGEGVPSLVADLYYYEVIDAELVRVDRGWCTPPQLPHVARTVVHDSGWGASVVAASDVVQRWDREVVMRTQNFLLEDVVAQLDVAYSVLASVDQRCLAGRRSDTFSVTVGGVRYRERFE